MKEQQRLIICETQSTYCLTNAAPGEYQEIEGNWYVDPSAVDQKFLCTTQLEYRCPYKGRCFYVDFDDGVRCIPRVAWIYDEVKPDWEHIKDKYGFYAGAVAMKFGKTEDTLRQS